MQTEFLQQMESYHPLWNWTFACSHASFPP